MLHSYKVTSNDINKINEKLLYIYSNQHEYPWCYTNTNSAVVISHLLQLSVEVLRIYSWNFGRNPLFTPVKERPVSFCFPCLRKARVLFIFVSLVWFFQ